MRFYPSSQSASDCFDNIQKALKDAGILTDLTLVGALATVRIEVGRTFLPISENTNGVYLENRPDLGNYIPGDGYTYRGRGFIQITGRTNYTNYGKVLGIDLVCHPELALNTVVSSKILALYFRDRGCDIACNSRNWVKVRELVNGGDNQLNTFLSVVAQYMS